MATPVVNEGTTAQFSCSFVDHTGADISDTAISAIAATLRDVASNQIINSRTSQDVLNTNGGTLATGGGFTLLLTGAADNVSIRGAGSNQVRRLTLAVTYATGTLTTEFTYVLRDLADMSNIFVIGP
jgi:hypothetical protein